MTLQTFEGGCHCGRVRFRVTAELSRVTDCNCSICGKKGFLHLIVPLEQFELLRGEAFIRSTCRVQTPIKSTSMSAASTASI
jgi:hypothetical protein